MILVTEPWTKSKEHKNLHVEPVYILTCFDPRKTSIPLGVGLKAHPAGSEWGGRPEGV